MKCFYHNDLDGRCAGAVVAQFTKNYNKEDYFEVDYVKPLPLDKIQEGETVYFVDYSFKKDTVWQLDRIISNNCNVVWIDHHTSSINLENEIVYLSAIEGIRQDKISGAALTYMYFNNCTFENIPYYIQLVSDYDCWIYKYDPDTTFFKIGMETFEYDALDDIWKKLYCDMIQNKNDIYNNSWINQTINKGKIIKSYIDRDNKQYYNQYAYETEIEGYKCIVVNRKTNSWIFGENYNKYPLVMVWAFNGEKYSYSIFSGNKDVDCSKIAEKFGGGGHKGAAGFSSNEMLFKKV